MSELHKRRNPVFFQISLIIFGLLGSLNSSAQDPIFNQPYATPMYTNPAFTGTTNFNTGGRASLNYRNQWPSLVGSFQTTAFSYDQHVKELGGGLGLLLTQDVAGKGLLTTSTIVLNYSYLLKVYKQIRIRLGLGLGIRQRSLDPSLLRFEDQIDATRGFVKPTSEPIGDFLFTTNSLSTGFLIYDKSWHLGFGIDNLNEPNESFYGDPSAYQPLRMTALAGKEITLSSWEREKSSVSFNSLYIQQAKFSQLNIGSYLTTGWLVTGLWYKRVFSQDFDDTHQTTAILGWRRNKIRAAYSYDLTFLAGGNTYASHEVSVVWQWERKNIVREKTDLLSYPEF